MKAIVFLAALTLTLSGCATNRAPAAQTKAPAAEEPANLPVSQDQCSPDLDKVIEAVEKSDGCYSAAKIARDCAWGSSADIRLAGAASAVCEKDFSKMGVKDKSTKQYMEKRCTEKYAKAEGTLAMSMRAHCFLGIAEFWSGIYTPVQN